MAIREANLADYSNLMAAQFLAGLSYEERETKWIKILSNIAQDNFTYIAEDEIG